MQNSQDSHSYPLIFIPNWPICQLKISQTGTKVPFPAFFNGDTFISELQWT
jgi:hypothetical protein